MLPTTAPASRYGPREAQGRIEQINANGLKLDGIWWDISRIRPVDLSAYHVGDGVYVCASETLDGQRRFIDDIGPLQPVRGPAPVSPTYVDDLPDDGLVVYDELPDQESRDSAQQPGTDRHLVADRLACLQVAAGVLTPWWIKKGADPDPALLLGIADQLTDWLRR